MSLTQSTRSGNRERRLYRGRCSAISRSSRTSASSSVGHGTGRTRSASRTISAIRVRISLAVKYERTRALMSLDRPTYSTRPCGSSNR